jgi:hypothetical protein
VLKEETIPEREIGPHCSEPYTCDFWAHCWKHVPEYSIFNISRLLWDKKWELYNMNILELKDIPEDFPLSDKQWEQVQSEVNQEAIIDKENIKSFVDDLQYPLYFMDFETFATAVPLFDNSGPYKPLVFQYSLHVLRSKDGPLGHKEFLAEGDGNDPRLRFIERLIEDCGQEGDVLVYNIGFERSKLTNLAEVYPEHEEAIMQIVDRLKDLMLPFQKKWYYTPAMRGSYSIKEVLPAMVPELSYGDLNIQEGGTASSTFAAIMTGDFNGDVEQTRKDLLDYCKLDTFAMVEILNKLKSV